MQNIMRGAVYTLVVVISFFCAEYSQAETFRGKLREKTPEERAELQTRIMQQVLKLDDKQRAAVYEINLKRAKQAQPLIEKSRLRHRDKRKMRRLNLKRNKELEALLTNKQYKMYEQKKEDIRKKIKSDIMTKTSH